MLKLIRFLQKIIRWPFLALGIFFRPSQRIKSFSEISLAGLARQGYRGIILDLDNTILPRQEKLLNHGFISWLEEAKKLGFKIAIVSNNFKKGRLNKIFKQTSLIIVNPAFKPLPFGFRLAISQTGVPAEKNIVIGDQITTDILGGNLLGCYTILCEPLYLETNPFRKFVQSLDGTMVKLFLGEQKK